jgi:hypothetical protein
MSVTQNVRKSMMGVAALGAVALGGSAIANAADNGSSSSTTTTTTPQQSGSGAAPQAGYGAPPAGQRPDPTKPGGHRGANGKTEAALPSDVAAKVKAAAEAKVSGGTVERVETDVDHGSPYEAHVRKADGTELEVLVDKDFNVTAVNTMQHP